MKREPTETEGLPTTGVVEESHEKALQRQHFEQKQKNLAAKKKKVEAHALPEHKEQILSGIKRHEKEIHEALAAL